MGIKFIDTGSPNYWQDDRPIKAICLHGTAGSLQSSLDWLRNPQKDNPGKAVSANFLVSKAGVIYRLVDPALGRKAWANGIVESTDKSLTWLSQAIKDGINPNRLTWSVEHEATDEEMHRLASMTNAQFTASIELVAYLLKLARLKANHETLISHSQISGRQKFFCPGVIFVPAYTEQLLIRHPELA